MVVGQLLITPTVDIFIQQLGRVEEMVDCHMMRYGIFSKFYLCKIHIQRECQIQVG